MDILESDLWSAALVANLCFYSCSIFAFISFSALLDVLRAFIIYSMYSLEQLQGPASEIHLSISSRFYSKYVILISISYSSEVSPSRTGGNG